MSKSITQDMAYRQSLMKYTEKYGVSRASRKYNKSRSYIYFWKQRWDGSVASLVCQSRRPHSHPNQHTEAELKLIRDMRRRNPELLNKNFSTFSSTLQTLLVYYGRSSQLLSTLFPCVPRLFVVKHVVKNRFLNTLMTGDRKRFFMVCQSATDE